ncbi:MAG: hypothetical protein E3K37_03520 [Candidatus Kuenenia sp.]|nr:hypothetical protein [Candidatus Kuenenia hertensis]
MKNKVLHYNIPFLFLLLCIVYINGCATLHTPLTEQDLSNVKNHEKYPLRVAVITNNIEHLSFIPEKDNNMSFRSRGNNYYSYFPLRTLIAGCKDFFPCIFQEVNFINSSDTGENQYDLFINFIPKGFTDFTQKSTSFVNLNFKTEVEILKSNGEVLDSIPINVSGSSNSGAKLLDRKRETLIPLFGGSTAISYTVTDNRSYRERKNNAINTNYSDALTKISRDVFMELSSYLTHHPNPIDGYVELLNFQKKQELERQTLPSNLVVQVQYSDSASIIPNNKLDASEESIIHTTVTNEGKGTAFDVSISCNSQFPHITFPETISIGDLHSGASKTISIPVQADINISSGAASFLIKANEKRGYSSRPIELQVLTAELIKPVLLFTSCIINDASGLAIGDGDGIPENNETIELHVFLKNEGKGKALQTAVRLSNTSPGIEAMKEKDVLTFIDPYMTEKATLAFKIPRTFFQNEITYTITATDVRGIATKKDFSVPFEPVKPNLSCSYKITDAFGKEVSALENGMSYILKITAANSGKNVAEGVTMLIVPKTSGASVGYYDNAIGAILPGSSGRTVNIPVSISRSYGNSELVLDIALYQEGFPGISKAITFPVTVKIPELQCDSVLLNEGSQDKISRNSWPRFRVNVTNNGTLDATGVRMRFHVYRKDISFEKEEIIGIVKAGESQFKDVTFLVKGNTEIGTMPVKIEITQEEFPPLVKEYSYQIVEQTAMVQRVEPAGEGAGKGFTAPVSAIPPELYINYPHNNSQTTDAAISLHGSIVTFGRGNAVQQLSVYLNDKPLRVVPASEDFTNEKNLIIKKEEYGGKTVFDGHIFLSSGENEIKITGNDRNNLVTEKIIKVTRNMKLGNIYAVVIGISNFFNEEYNLKYAASDAERFYRFLRSENGGKIQGNHIKFLTDSRATRAGVIEALTKFMGRATKEDTVEIYIATHGIIDTDGRFYCLCYDSDTNNLRGTALFDNELTDIIRNDIKAGKIILYLDACHSGLSGLSERYTRRGLEVRELNDRINSLVKELSKHPTPGVATFSASSAEGYSQEDTKWNGGVFTHCLIKGLKGEANADNDEWITIKELEQYLTREVRTLTNGKQCPKVDSTLMENTPVAKVY